MRTLLVLLVFVGLVLDSNATKCGCSNNGRGKRDLLPNGEMQVDDMTFTQKDMMMFQESKFRAGNIHGPSKWPQGTITYHIREGDHRMIKQALDELTKKTQNCVKFVEGKPSNPNTNYVEVYNRGPGICTSYVGRQRRGRQLLSLGRGCMRKKIIQHEFMHALGFYHEHNRPDREQYLTMNWNNIRPAYCFAYNKCRNCKTYTPYDIHSIMHYGQGGFTCNGKETFTVKTGEKIHYNYNLTKYDIIKIRKHYGCE